MKVRFQPSSRRRSFTRPHPSPGIDPPSNTTLRTLPVTQGTVHQSVDDRSDVTCSSSSPPCPRQDSSAVVPYPYSSLLTPLRSHLERRGMTRGSVGKQPPRKGDPGHIKWPENAFILFRKQKCEEHQSAQESTNPTKKWRQADLSKQISQQWKTLPLKEKWYWKALAEAKKAWHEAMYPGYVYSPRPRKKKVKMSSHSESEDTQEQGFCFLLATLSLNDTENCGLTHVNDPNCNTFRPEPPSTSPADDQPTIPFQSSAGKTPTATSTGGYELEPEVAIQHPSHDLFFTQTFENPSTLDGVTLLVSSNIPLW